MYINDVIRRVRDCKPNEYENAELYYFCDEVSAMLSVEDRQAFKECIIPISSDGTFLLPCGVRFENIQSVMYGGIELEKSDLRSFGARAVKCDSQPITSASSVSVVYTVPYSPIRLPKYKGTVTSDKDTGTLIIDHCDFIPGDSLVLECDGTVTEGIPLLDIDYMADSNTFSLTVSPQSIKDIPDGEHTNATLTRTVTEQTVCDAPFDSMYIDYLLAKISLYQGDNKSCNQYMTMFNSRLLAYKEWLVGKIPGKKYTLKNWW